MIMNDHQEKHKQLQQANQKRQDRVKNMLENQITSMNKPDKKKKEKHSSKVQQ